MCFNESLEAAPACLAFERLLGGTGPSVAVDVDVVIGLLCCVCGAHESVCFSQLNSNNAGYCSVAMSMLRRIFAAG